MKNGYGAIHCVTIEHNGMGIRRKIPGLMIAIFIGHFEKRNDMRLMINDTEFTGIG